jgi:hypothetical protein
MTKAIEYFDIVFDQPPSPNGCTFIEIETDKGRSFNLGQWLKRPDGYWVIRVGQQDVACMFDGPARELRDALEELLAAHSNESIGVGASARRIKAKERARAAIAKVQP